MSRTINFYISDLHFGHTNIINFDNRPFKDTEEMNNALVNNWNNVVTKQDNVYILGDMFWNNSDAIKILPILNGNKFLIKGNHDRFNKDMKKHFVWIKDYAIIHDNDEHIVLCHYPIVHWINADYGYIHLYGHIHNARDNRPFEQYKNLMKQRNIPYECYNVGCMLHNYTPITLEQLRNETINK